MSEEVLKEFTRMARGLGRDRLADLLDIDERTVRRWEQEGVPNEKLIYHALQNIKREELARARPEAKFDFIDLFAGIGGIRLGFESAGGQCVFTSEWDKYAQKTYSANFSDEHGVWGDIREITASSSSEEVNNRHIDEQIPDHDVLLAGFPCQPFSLAGVSKKNSLGRRHGFMCEAQGTLFFDVARIIEVKRPPAFLLENVKNLKSHDKGNTYRVIRNVLENDLGYRLFDRVIDARGFVPQHRERIYMVGFREDVPFSWDHLEFPHPNAVLLGNILHPEDGSEEPESHFTAGDTAKVTDKYVLSAHLWNYLQEYRRKHEAKGNGFGYSKFGPMDTARTLSARYHKDGSEILIDRGKRKRPRRLTPRECARLMGYPEGYMIPVSDTQAYRQFGNSVVVPVIKEIAHAMLPHIEALKTKATDQNADPGAKLRA